MPSYNKLVSLGLTAALILSSALSAWAKDKADRPVKSDEMRKNQKPPRQIKRVDPLYPLGMSRAGVIGSVMVELVIDKEGNVPDAFVHESNNPWFERAAIDAVMQWKFEPAEVDGQRVNTRARQLIEFKVYSSGEAPELWRTTKGKDHDKLPAEFRWHTAPVPKLTTFPVYPFELLKAGARGKVRISYVVGPNGRVVRAKLQSADLPEFGAAVLAMIDAWRFEPPKMKDGTPCYASLGSEYEFIPNGRGEVPVADNAKHILHYVEKQPERIVPADELDQPLKPRSRRPPAYPTALAEAGQPGEAMIEFYVDREGDVQLPKIISSSAPEFGYAAVQAVATWRFDPPKKGGKRVVVCARIPVNFGMDEPKKEGQKSE